MTADAENVKLAIQAAWLINEPAFALTLALRDHALRSLCLQCAAHPRRLVEGVDAISLVCRQCYRTTPTRETALQHVPTLTASIYTPQTRLSTYSLNSLWFDTTELRAYVRRRFQWMPLRERESDELFDLLGVEPDQIHKFMTNHATLLEVEDA